MRYAIVLVASALGSGVLTARLIHYTRARAILDIPNERSMHRTPTPRGGGLAIALVWIVGELIVWAKTHQDGRVTVVLTLVAAFIASIGWADDRRGLSARLRLSCHILASAVSVYVFGPVRIAALVYSQNWAFWLDCVLSTVAVAWCINLYNFMDGIDGIAAVEAVTVSLSAAVCLAESGAPQLAYAALLLAGAALGFLVWNWAPARIFLGDAGSGLLGYVLGALALRSISTGALPISIWLLLLGVFLVDATLTLLRRALKPAQLAIAHRDHAYQRLARRVGSHALVSLGVLALNIVAGCLAVFSVRQQADAFPLMVSWLIVLCIGYVATERVAPRHDAALHTGESC